MKGETDLKDTRTTPLLNLNGQNDKSRHQRSGILHTFRGPWGNPKMPLTKSESFTFKRYSPLKMDDIQMRMTSYKFLISIQACLVLSRSVSGSSQVSLSYPSELILKVGA